MEYIPESTQAHIDDLVETINKLNKDRNKLISENESLKKQLSLCSVVVPKDTLVCCANCKNFTLDEDCDKKYDCDKNYSEFQAK